MATLPKTCVGELWLRCISRQLMATLKSKLFRSSNTNHSYGYAQKNLGLRYVGLRHSHKWTGRTPDIFGYSLSPSGQGGALALSLILLPYYRAGKHSGCQRNQKRAPLGLLVIQARSSKPDYLSLKTSSVLCRKSQV